jgi:hypothetical protein
MTWQLNDTVERLFGKDWVSFLPNKKKKPRERQRSCSSIDDQKRLCATKCKEGRDYAGLQQKKERGREVCKAKQSKVGR